MKTTLMTTSKMLVQLLAVLFVVKMATARPSGASENQLDHRQELDQINSPEFRKFLSTYNSLQNYPLTDDIPLDRLQMQLLAQYAQNSNSIIGSNVGGGGGNGGNYYDLYRTPEIKRQIRYRQCYFNPISCFRK